MLGALSFGASISFAVGGPHGAFQTKADVLDVILSVCVFPSKCPGLPWSLVQDWLAVRTYYSYLEKRHFAFMRWDSVSGDSG